MNMDHDSIAARHFDRKTRQDLLKKGIRLISLTRIPGTGPLPMANGETGYQIDDNGTGKIKTFLEVLRLSNGA